MLTEDQKTEMCQELDACHAYREQLSQYERQALLHYAESKRAELARMPEDEQKYYRLIFPIYNAADVATTLLATPAVIGKPADAPKLSLRQVALLHIYTGQQIPNSEADTIARAYGHNSGQKLCKHYNRLVPIKDRINVSEREIKPLIKDVQTVLPHLTGQQRKYAEDELQTLESKIIDRS